MQARVSNQSCSVFRKVEHYLVGCLNEPAHHAWILAVAKATRDGAALDTGLQRICESYLKATKA